MRVEGGLVSQVRDTLQNIKASIDGLSELLESQVADFVRAFVTRQIPC